MSDTNREHRLMLDQAVRALKRLMDLGYTFKEAMRALSAATREQPVPLPLNRVSFVGPTYFERR